VKSWAAIVFATAGAEGAPIQSRLPAFLHPLAGRPLVWHSIHALTIAANPPAAIHVITGSTIPDDIFDDLSFPISFVREDSLAASTEELGAGEVERILVIDAAALVRPAAVAQLLDEPVGSWIPGASDEIVVGVTDARGLDALLSLAEPMAGPNSVFAPERRTDFAPLALKVSTRADLATAHGRIRDRLVSALMEAGVTFVLPESVSVDVGVRIGKDSVVYPGAVLEGQTTIGEETVIGPSCRIIDSWVGSGVELRGWNYLANTSIRNRAILEPYVRRGFE
jgi:bifunctional N-acetylglucosamine-1-phosphate-uridyltransferase/glucosamine-1-phosphate-acetyltransferase GlmU-like protein